MYVVGSPLPCKGMDLCGHGALEEDMGSRRRIGETLLQTMAVAATGQNS